MTAEQRVEQPQTPESEQQISFERKIYPMGLTGSLKRELIEFIVDLKQSPVRTEIEKEVAELARDIECQLPQAENLEEFQPFFDLVHKVDDYLTETGQQLETLEEFVTRGLHTEEEIAVIFAKTSRSPASFEEIAKEVTEESAANFHQKWVVSVEGYGHASVSEHAILHLAVEHFSSAAIDWITDNRLASFTEQSARFQIMPPGYYYIPEAIKKDSLLLPVYCEAQDAVVASYEELIRRGFEYITTEEFLQRDPGRRQGEKEKDGAYRLRIQKIVKDNFKNLMTTARLSNVGVTFNAREAENAIRKMLSSGNEEVETIGRWVKEEGLKITPTLIKYAERSDYLAATRDVSKSLAARIDSGIELQTKLFEDEKQTATLERWDEDAENRFLAAFLYDGGPLYSSIYEQIVRMSLQEKEAALDEAFKRLGGHDVPIRDSEFAGYYLYEFLCTYGALRDIKRHRMMTYKPKPLSIDYGYAIPDLACEMEDLYPGTVDMFTKAMGKIEDAYEVVSNKYPDLAQYLVTRSHIRPTLANFNFREAVHFFRLRTGPTTHFQVVKVVSDAYRQAKEVHPLLWRHIKMRSAT